MWLLVFKRISLVSLIRFFSDFFKRQSLNSIIRLSTQANVLIPLISRMKIFNRLSIFFEMTFFIQSKSLILSDSQWFFWWNFSFKVSSSFQTPINGFCVEILFSMYVFTFKRSSLVFMMRNNIQGSFFVSKCLSQASPSRFSPRDDMLISTYL